MANAPWYLESGTGPSLKHQKAPEYDDDPHKLEDRFKRGQKVGPAAKKYRKGACTNCGAMSHTTKDCVERPRKVGARWTNRNIAADEVVHDPNAHLNFQRGRGDFDAKRDRWDGYDPATHRQVVLEHEALEDARRRLREEAIDKGASSEVKESALAKAAKLDKKAAKQKKKQQEDDDDDFGSSSEDDDDDGGNKDDDEKYADSADVAGQKFDNKNRMTVRNLRIREDTAKYLMNLDLESAHYDPKTRSMREAPRKDVDPEEAKFAGENFLRGSGESEDVRKLQLFAWQAESRGNDVHVQGLPTQAHLAHREFLGKKDALKETSSQSILAKYGGEKYLNTAPKELLSGQTENYVEYSRTGQVIKGQERAKARSRYDEDVYPGNHKSVWGSYFSRVNGTWGYACCHSSVYNSFCAGQAAIDAEKAELSGNLIEAPPKQIDPNEGKSLVELHNEKSKGTKRKAGEDDTSGIGRKRQVGEDDVDARLDKGKLKDVLEGKGDKRAGHEVSEEDMEAYRLGRDQFDDPMKALGKDELLPL